MVPTGVHESIISGVVFLLKRDFFVLLTQFSLYQSRRPSDCTFLISIPRFSDVALLDALTANVCCNVTRSTESVNVSGSVDKTVKTRQALTAILELVYSPVVI